MRYRNFLVLLGLIIFFASFQEKDREKHLFILSGQSNMELLQPNESFIPILSKRFGKKSITVVKFAKGTQPIRKWYRDWKPLEGKEPKADPILYDSLMIRVSQSINREDFSTVTFVWMQGERDAHESLGNVYEKSLLGLYQQLSNDLNRNDVNFIIGRLSDCGLTKKGWPDWSMIREIQVKVAESHPRFGWINTDDLNEGVNRKGEIIQNDIHMSRTGYIVMGERFARKAIELIESNP
ncbi:sialate O-acetylesterase [Leeuwenhoekiella parthenopeia]|uniref:Sialate O-acetylesterase domain-containing protein n=1 Tax=Leeuwenhoekiella parthenopeia TaxID=2890320 RepID=A0ABS8GTW5_9FLAO|nr:sialate O-acetylesterase [Leeuwenhoekiella parthenopeia]MCC4212003.1 hypothetical protein [Leeuwenhoekiella parthenopeia]